MQEGLATRGPNTGGTKIEDAAWLEVRHSEAHTKTVRTQIRIHDPFATGIDFRTTIITMIIICI